ncbi:MAG: NFACT RNA binding domain-containing protein [Deltaproteobacteria bacterium]|nr:NFACT RNA binding domain-containing protein [Deltaproteobacteria bacterium]
MTDFEHATETLTPPKPLACDPSLPGARIQGVWQPGEDRLVLETHHPGHGTAWWLFSLDAEQTRLARLSRKETRGGAPPAFCLWLRSRLTGGRVDGVFLRHPQVLELRIEKGEEAFLLRLELNRRLSNLLLLDAEERLLMAMRHPALAGRTLGRGQPYVPPRRLYPYPAGTPLERRYPALEADASREQEAWWRLQHARTEAPPSAHPAQAALRRARQEHKKLAKRMTHLTQDQAHSAQAEGLKHQGELLQIHRHLLSPGLTEVELPDVFAPEQPRVRIPLDPTLDPSQNIERYFRRYRKARDSAAPVAGRLEDTQDELEALDALLAALELAESEADLKQVVLKFPWAARILAPPAPKPSAASKGAGAPGSGGEEVMTRLSADGLTVLVGRNKEENDRVTFRLGNGRDWWFHVQGLPGSHVLVKTPDGALPPPKTLREAAWLAAYYSTGRGQGKLDVDYTQRKHVRKIKGAEPGQVTYAQNKTIYVDVADEQAKAVLHRTVDAVAAPGE